MPLLRLRNPFETPPGYFRYPRHPERPLSSDPKDFIIGGDLVNLIAKVSEFRIINRMTLGDVEADVNDWLCRASGAPCSPVKPRDMQPGRKARGGDVARFLKAMLLWLPSRGYVSQEEADHRAELCSGCRFNVPIDDSSCLGCFGLMARIMQAIGPRRTRFQEVLKFCGVCGCSNEVSAFAPMEELNKIYKNLEFPDDIGQVDAGGKPVPCWKRTDLK